MFQNAGSRISLKIPSVTISNSTKKSVVNVMGSGANGFVNKKLLVLWHIKSTGKIGGRGCALRKVK